MTKTHRIETIEEYNADGKLIRKTVTEENEEWYDDEQLKKYSQYPYINPCENGPSDSTSTKPMEFYYDTGITTANH